MRKIVFDREAKSWGEALPVGNGRMGAMIFGGIKSEHLGLNEDSIWYGKPVNRINPDAHRNLEKVRELILGGKPDEAEELLSYAFTATPQSQRVYQPLADCWINLQGSCGEPAKESGYCRWLDLGTAVVTVDYSTKKGKIHREYLASYPQKVVAAKFETEGEETLNFDLLLTREPFYDEMVMDEENSVYLTGNLGKGGLDFVAGCRIETDGGSVRRIGEHLVVKIGRAHV